MGFISNIRSALALPAQAAALTPVSPFSPRDVLRSIIVPSDTPAIVDRTAAMGLAPLAKARRVICSSVAKCPLVLQRGGEPVDHEPPWMSGTNGPISPYHRMVWTVDDLLFYGFSLWAVERDSAGQIVAADRVPIEYWSLTAEGEVTYRGNVVSPDECVLIPGIDEGILAYPEPLRHAIDLNKSAARAAKIPIPHTELKQVSGKPLSDKQKNDLISEWISARQSKNGGVSFTNAAIEVKTHGQYDARVLVDGVQAQSVQLAQITGIPAIILDAANSDGTMRYSNVNARNAELLDYCLSSFMGPIAARLGLDDIVGTGYSVDFDVSSLKNLDDSFSTPDNEKGK